MAITIPSIDQPGVSSRPLSAPQINPVAVDDSAFKLQQQVLGQAGKLVSNQIEQEQERADTAALMGAEAQLSQRKLDMMFSPEGGVYTRKGKSALNITNETLPAFDQSATEIGKSLTNDRQRARWAQITGQQRQGLNQELNRYEFGERQSFYDSTEKANVATSLDAAIRYANDPQQVAYYQNKANAVIGSRGMRLGLPPEAIELERAEFNSGLAVGVITHLSSKDPLAAQQYYAKAAGSMLPADQEKIGKMLGTSVRQQMATGIADTIWNAGSVGDQALPALIMKHESGGQVDAVSPKGALGAMQLMPETAKEVAADLGIPFDLERLTTDANYNAALGTAYINKMLGRYGGNQALAVAAYNAGPGSVDDWIKEHGDPRTGDISEADWIAKIPFRETREYTGKIMGDMAASVPASQKYADGLEAVARIPDPELAKFVSDRLDDHKKAADARGTALYEQAAEHVNDGGYSQIPAELLTQIPADEQQKLRRLDDYRRKGLEPTTDYQKLEGFLAMPVEKLAGLSLAKDIQPHLNKSDFNTVRSAWQAAVKGDGSVKGAASAEEKVIKNTMAMAGIVVGTSKDAQKASNLKAQQQFRSAIQERKDAFFRANQKDPTASEVQDMAEQMLLEVKLSGQGAFGSDSSGRPLWSVPPEDLENAFLDSGDLTIEQIPPRDRQLIINQLRKERREVSADNIVSDYINRISGQGLGVRIK